MKALIAFSLCSALSFAMPAMAQTNAQFTQLVTYTGKLAARLLVAEANVANQKAVINELLAFVKDSTCKANITNETLRAVSLAKDAAPVEVTLIYGKNCAKDGPAPTVPIPLP